ncbi:MAG: heme o synthase [Myxococcota bacterium]
MRSSSRLEAFYELAKPNLTKLVVVTGVFGYCLGAVRIGRFDLCNGVLFALGTALASAGACAANMVLERRTDGLMHRTSKRPLPSGRLSVLEASLFTLVTSSAGFGLLAYGGGLLPAMMSLGTIMVYAFVYTPLKRVGPWAIAVGAVPGAVPPMMGWTYATGSIGWEGWILFALLFAWQMPHFLALAYLYRLDYRRGGFGFLPSDEQLHRTGLAMALGCQAAVLASIGPVLWGLAGPFYAVGAGLAGGVFCYLGFRSAMELHPKSARAVFLGSLAYLPVLLVLILADQLVFL